MASDPLNLSPARFLARLEGRGFAGPYGVDPVSPKLVVDRDGNSVGIVAPVTDRPSPDGDRAFAAFVADALNRADRESRQRAQASRDPMQLASPQSRRLAESLSRKQAAAE